MERYGYGYSFGAPPKDETKPYRELVTDFIAMQDPNVVGPARPVTLEQLEQSVYQNAGNGEQ